MNIDFNSLVFSTSVYLYRGRNVAKVEEYNALLVECGEGCYLVHRLDEGKEVTLPYQVVSFSAGCIPHWNNHNTSVGDIFYNQTDDSWHVLDIEATPILDIASGKEIVTTHNHWIKVGDLAMAKWHVAVRGQEVANKLMLGEGSLYRESELIREVSTTNQIAKYVREQWHKSLTMASEARGMSQHFNMCDSVIFLDIDGVVNDMTGSMVGRYNNIAFELLRNLCELTRAKIVLSSTWRGDFNNYLQLGTFLQAYGLNRFIIETKDNNWRTVLGGDNPRGANIKQWLNLNPHIKHYIIIDDDSDMLPEQRPWHIHVNDEDGFTGSKYHDALGLFSLMHDFPYQSHTADFF